jgi:small subunit ribosomal protein S20
MANIKSAKKRISVISKKTLINRRVKNSLKVILKNFYKALETGDLSTAKDKLALAEKKLMQAAAKGTIHKNTASRKVGRMTRAYNKAKAEE